MFIACCSVLCNSILCPTRVFRCYVDAGACSLIHRSTDAEAIRGAGPLRLDRSRDFSYATCGSAQTAFSGAALRTALQGVELRVAFLANSGGWAGAYRSEGATAGAEYFNGAVGWYGPAVDFFHAVQLEAGFTVLQVDVPEEAVAASGSSSAFTQCAYATGMGYVDVCVGDFSITSSRNEITPFYTIDNAGIWLVTFAKAADDSASQLALVFSPFQGLVWACLFALLACIGLVIAIQEYATQVLASRRRIDFDDATVSPAQRRQDSQQISALHTHGDGTDVHDVCEMLIPRGHLPSASPKELAIHAGQSIFVAFESFASASGPTTLVSSWGGQFSVLALCWLVTLSIATYTGEIAAVLTHLKANGATSSLAEVISEGKPICCSRATSVATALVYPAAVIALDPVDGRPGLLRRSDIFRLMDDGTCASALIPLQDLEVEQSSSPPRNCDKIAVAEVMSVGRGYPMADSVARRLGWAMQKTRNLGEYELSLQRSRQEQKCSGDDLGDDSGRINGLSLSQMSGVFISVICIVAFGILLSVIGCCTTIGGPSVYAQARSQRMKLLNSKRVKAVRSKNSNRTTMRDLVINPYDAAAPAGTDAGHSSL